MIKYIFIKDFEGEGYFLLKNKGIYLVPLSTFTNLKNEEYKIISKEHYFENKDYYDNYDSIKKVEKDKESLYPPKWKTNIKLPKELQKELDEYMESYTNYLKYI